MSILSSQSHAQESGGVTFRGVLRGNSSQGRLLSGATVTLNPLSMQATTGAAGEYVFVNVPAGEYTVQFSKDGYWSYTSSLVSIGATEVVAPTYYLRLRSGSIVRSETHPAVYVIGSDGKRYLFPNQSTYDTWYSNFTSLIRLSDQELAAYALGGNVTIRPGTKLVTIQSTSRVYAVEPGGILRWIPDQAVAERLFGAQWTRLVSVVPAFLFRNYTISKDPITLEIHPVGTIIQYGGSLDRYRIMRVDGKMVKRKFISEEAFTVNGFRVDSIVSVPPSFSYPDGADIVGFEESFGAAYARDRRL